MNQYLYQLRPTRIAMLSDGPTEQEATAVQNHFNYLKELTDEGVVLVASRNLLTDENAFGLVIFEAEDDKAAQHIVDSDPAVQQKVMHATLFPHRVALWSSTGPTENS